MSTAPTPTSPNLIEAASHQSGGMIQTSVVTPERVVFEAASYEVVAPLIDGLYGVMPGHAPMVARLGEGLLKIRLQDDRVHHFYVEDGFVQILSNQVTILTGSAITDVDVDAVTKDLKAAEGIGNTSTEELESRQRRIQRARTLLKLAELNGVRDAAERSA